ncbi:MAG TPA: hypothetical protein VJA20_02355 [Candidatus Nanoarchaeia archaeon]|nr:hypothetical protein [Candidatus Nanoarchaeia archaeon]
MKKGLMILSISLILLVSLSFVSAESFGMRQTSLSYNGFPGLELSWFSDLFGGKSVGIVPTKSISAEPSSADRVSFSNPAVAEFCPTGWMQLLTSRNEKCCLPKN